LGSRSEESLESTKNWLNRLATKEPVEMLEYKVRCPSCSSDALAIKEYLYEIPYFGKVVLSEGRCTICGYRYVDVRSAEYGEPRQLMVQVEKEDSLRALIVKPANAVLYIVERGYEMMPGPASEGFISTIEGILMRFREAIELACRDRENDECKDHKSWISRAIEGKERFTLVICDFDGTSIVTGPVRTVVSELGDYCRSASVRAINWMRKR